MRQDFIYSLWIFCFVSAHILYLHTNRNTSENVGPAGLLQHNTEEESPALSGRCSCIHAGSGIFCSCLVRLRNSV